uniref:Uncharacterized protein n=1 Tax=Hanusia phi TaxID=3032 RepID=A0A7S0DWZ4_9CRYP|mmetsp:Transcript_12093/g.27945  ORF Transcript_12093/g.27945 Transcript_12093/m.27945 type:complete len:328 (+) Transcript_12093:28-1011(+)
MVRIIDVGYPLLSTQEPSTYNNLSDMQESIARSDKDTGPKALTVLQPSLRPASERHTECERVSQELREQLRERDREIERLRHEVRLLRSKANMSDNHQASSDRVCELEQESIVLASKYRSACRRNEMLEKRLRHVLHEQEASGTDEEREDAGGVWQAPSDYAEEQPGRLEVSALGALNLEDCRRPCPQTSIDSRTKAWVMSIGESLDPFEPLAPMADSASWREDSALSESSAERYDLEREEEVRYGYEKKEAVEGTLAVELTAQSCSLRANPMTGGFTRAAWKTPALGARGSGESGANYAGIFSSLLSSSAVNKTRRKQADIIAFDD